MRLIIQNLKACSTKPRITVDALLDYTIRDLPTAHRRLSKQLGYDQCLTTDKRMSSHPFHVLVSVIGLEEYPIERLALGDPKHGLHLSVFLKSTFHSEALRELSLIIRNDHPDSHIPNSVDMSGDWGCYADRQAVSHTYN